MVGYIYGIKMSNFFFRTAATLLSIRYMLLCIFFLCVSKFMLRLIGVHIISLCVDASFRNILGVATQFMILVCYFFFDKDVM